MSHEWTLARAFVGTGGSGRLHSSFAVSIVGVLLGVAFLLLTLGVYDSYVEKLESIAFTLYPHVLLVDGEASGQSSGPAPASSPETAPGAGESVSSPASTAAATVTDAPVCDRICGGERVLGAERWTAESAGLRLSMDRFHELDLAVREQPIFVERGGAALAPVVLEEADLALASILAPSSGPGSDAAEPVGSSELGALASARQIRVLGIDPEAPVPVPRVDLVLGREQLEALRRNPELVFLATDLEQEIDMATAEGPVFLRFQRAGASPLDLPVGGEFELGFHAVAHNLLITSVETAQALLGLDHEVSYVGIALEDPYDSRDFVEAMEPVFGEVGFRATDWTGIAGGDFESIRLFRWILFLVLGLSFLITALGIRNALAILTLERRRQIGILRALGSRDLSLRLIFLTIACGIGVVGAVPGAVLGSWLGIRFGEWLDRELAGLLPIQGVEMTWQPLALGQVLALVLLVCALTSMVAVERALELDTVTCLREE